MAFIISDGGEIVPYFSDCSLLMEKSGVFVPSLQPQLMRFDSPFFLLHTIDTIELEVKVTFSGFGFLGQTLFLYSAVDLFQIVFDFSFHFLRLLIMIMCPVF